MQGNEELKKRQILSAQIDLSKFNKGDFIKATEEEKKQQDVMGESTTFFKDGMKRLKKNPLAMGSIVILVLILVLLGIAVLTGVLVALVAVLILVLVLILHRFLYHTAIRISLQWTASVTRPQPIWHRLSTRN